MSDESPQAKGAKGGRARAAVLTSAERSEQASLAAKARWGTNPPATESEIKVLGRVVSHLAELEQAGRKRVFVYLRSLFINEWPMDND